MKKQVLFAENTREALVYPFLFVFLLWIIWFAQETNLVELNQFGLLPRSLEGLIGIITMPFLHSTIDSAHLLSNSVPAYFLMAGLIYYYKPIALKVFVLSWVLTGIVLWIIADNTGARHVGFSGVIYALVSFLFLSGILRKFIYLQVLSLLVVFLYGSLIWGIFPTKEPISWEGHLSGLLVGIFLAYIYRLEGPQRVKFAYEIEKEMGIEPPDLEGIYNEKLALAQEKERSLAENQAPVYVYYYETKNVKLPPETDQ